MVLLCVEILRDSLSHTHIRKVSGGHTTNCLSGKRQKSQQIRRLSYWWEHTANFLYTTGYHYIYSVGPEDLRWNLALWPCMYCIRTTVFLLPWTKPLHFRDRLPMLIQNTEYHSDFICYILCSLSLSLSSFHIKSIHVHVHDVHTLYSCFTCTHSPSNLIHPHISSQWRVCVFPPTLHPYQRWPLPQLSSA